MLEDGAATIAAFAGDKEGVARIMAFMVRLGTEADDEEFCPDCFAGMESARHHRRCTLGRGPWPGRAQLHDLQDVADEFGVDLNDEDAEK